MGAGSRTTGHVGDERGKVNCVLVLFDSPHQALRAEAALKRAGIPHAVVNTPREFSLHCGVSLRVPVRFRGATEEVLRQEGTGFREMVSYFSRWIGDG
jgi:hypothetical protein